MTFSLTPSYPDNPRLDELVTRLRDYLDGELADYERGLGLGPETPLDRSMLEPVWQRSRELGFYGIHLPTSLGERVNVRLEEIDSADEVTISPAESARASVAASGEGGSR